jgi:CcmD family protein
VNDAGVIIGSYAVTIVAIGGYVVWMLRRARRLSELTRDEDRPWT